MSKVTLALIIAFIVAFGSFLFYSYVNGVVEDAFMGVTAQVVQESPIDNSAKQAINISLWAVGVAGFVGLIAGGYAIFNKYLG